VTRLDPSDHVIVVGAGLAGWRLVEALRREGFAGELTLIGDEAHLPYDRPPLTKQVLVGKWDVEKATLATPELVDQSGATLRLGVAATALDTDRGAVTLSDGSHVVGSRVVVATGARARHLGFSADDRIHYLRRAEDVVRLNRELETLGPGGVVAVIGGGFIGAESATAVRTRGFEPIVLEVASRPLIGVLGEHVSAWLLGLASAVGIELRVNQVIEDVVEDGDGLHVLFADGTELAVGAVIAGVGVEANVEWLDGSGVLIDNGVVVDEHLVAGDRLAAIGDVARFAWRSVTGTELVRIEHWEVANVHASTLARYWVSDTEPAALMVPYFWSDQYGKKIQLLGHPRPSDHVLRVSGGDDEAKWLALYSRNDVVTGIVTLSNPRDLMLSKPLLEEPTTMEQALAAAPWEA
jgi:3-phenylpropionate/trans-cinnamate dioxygenase ferredoxin reductase subunit